MVELASSGRDAEEIPLHYESTGLRSWIPVVGWPLGLLLVGVGLSAIVWGHGSLLEVLGVVLAMKGGLILTGITRCRRHEVVVTERWLEAGAGPLRRKVPVGFVGPSAVRSATSWRSLFADREVVLQLTVGSREIVFPTADPEETLEALEKVFEAS